MAVLDFGVGAQEFGHFVVQPQPHKVLFPLDSQQLLHSCICIVAAVFRPAAMPIPSLSCMIGSCIISVRCKSWETRNSQLNLQLTTHNSQLTTHNSQLTTRNSQIIPCDGQHCRAGMICREYCLAVMYNFWFRDQTQSGIDPRVINCESGF